ncbi:MAG TPA: hypothetical protein VKL21_09985 [Candidatus Methanoperedens sp.]|nr:hypothetical protein [Candidatus Methanoperedens sp.]
MNILVHARSPTSASSPATVSDLNDRTTVDHRAYAPQTRSLRTGTNHLTSCPPTSAPAPLHRQRAAGRLCCGNHRA